MLRYNPVARARKSGTCENGVFTYWKGTELSDMGKLWQMPELALLEVYYSFHGVMGPVVASQQVWPTTRFANNQGNLRKSQVLSLGKEEGDLPREEERKS